MTRPLAALAMALLVAGMTGCGPEDPYYANCAAVIAASAAPLHRGKAGYRPALDRNGDGIACGTEETR